MSRCNCKDMPGFFLYTKLGPVSGTKLLAKVDHMKLLVCCAPTYPLKLALPKKKYGHSREMMLKNLKTTIQFQISVLIKAS